MAIEKGKTSSQILNSPFELGLQFKTRKEELEERII